MGNDKLKFNYTVKELIEQLQKLPQDLPVLTTGYESGYENIREPKIVKVEYKPNSAYYDGEFQEAEEKAAGIFESVVLEREVRNG